MASFQVARTATTLSPTVRTLACGTPAVSPLLNIHVRAPADNHGHGHEAGPRSDVAPKWAAGPRRTSSGLFAKTFTTLPPTSVFQSRLLHTSAVARYEPQVPNYAGYRAPDAESNRALSYFMIGSMGLVTASVAKSSVTEFLKTMSASADVLAMAKVEVELNAIPEGKNVVIKWRGKPVFIRHRTPEEIEEARSANWRTFRDPESDEARTKKPEWLIMLGVCTHLGCVPIGEAGDYGGWFCPCHGSHYDISGRARKGPAPNNLEIPGYEFNEAEGKVIIG
ncbi:ubiquinol-cytochrome c reductase iron-sulfur subunit [Fistulina hepatica ATCC 64428]|uniref:Cytochrome b-c1 complex subunit Rieske, mitochondrial n=1 Tax=Fistulina hepatica ATCC 64428 TaxID=1128425 RepID=A0A0D7AHG9_9AGAR|nr:ubiquinol-cytochrome c reductase iron-sulfur subunit [Fistulina hepatica ATCC 64428]